MMFQPESKLTARLFLRLKKGVKEAADWVSWANVAAGIQLSLAENNATISLPSFLPIEEGKKSERK